MTLLYFNNNKKTLRTKRNVLQLNLQLKYCQKTHIKFDNGKRRALPIYLSSLIKNKLSRKSNKKRRKKRYIVDNASSDWCDDDDCAKQIWLSEFYPVWILFIMLCQANRDKCWTILHIIVINDVEIIEFRRSKKRKQKQLSEIDRRIKIELDSRDLFQRQWL